MSRRKGKLIIISAPSGCGKTTIAEHLLCRNPAWKRSISYTTRAPRNGEADGRDYFFVSRNQFLKRKKAGFFIETAEVFGHSYGTSKRLVLDELAKGVNVVLAIDVQGMKQISAKLGGKKTFVSFFIMPPSERALKRRLEKRKTETKAEIGKRLEIAKQEMAKRFIYDYVVVNRRIDQAVRSIEERVNR
jgi:guanylate kinase